MTKRSDLCSWFFECLFVIYFVLAIVLIIKQPDWLLWNPSYQRNNILSFTFLSKMLATETHSSEELLICNLNYFLLLVSNCLTYALDLWYVLIHSSVYGSDTDYLFSWGLLDHFYLYGSPNDSIYTMFLVGFFFRCFQTTTKLIFLWPNVLGMILCPFLILCSFFD